VRELVLVLPDLRTGDAVGASSTMLRSLRFAAVAPLRGGWRPWLARSLGREDLAVLDFATVVSRALAASIGSAGGDAGVERPGAWIATPLHLQAGLTTVHLPPDGILRLEPGEAQRLAAGFGAVFGADGLQLSVVPGDTLLLSGLVAPGVRATEPASLLGCALDDALPSGPGSAPLRALMTEIEMWLHEHPVNQARARRGEPPVTSLWLWGGGGAATAGEPVSGSHGTASATPDWTAIRTDDAWVSAACRMAGLSVAPAPAALEPDQLARQGARDCVVLSAGCRQGLAGGDPAGLLQHIDRSFIGPACEALRGGSLQQLTLVSSDRVTRVTHADRLRLWRPRRDWFQALSL
jgi:hypothetical protein